MDEPQRGFQLCAPEAEASHLSVTSGDLLVSLCCRGFQLCAPEAEASHLSVTSGDHPVPVPDDRIKLPIFHVQNLPVGVNAAADDVHLHSDSPNPRWTGQLERYLRVTGIENVAPARMVARIVPRLRRRGDSLLIANDFNSGNAHGRDIVERVKPQPHDFSGSVDTEFNTIDPTLYGGDDGLWLVEPQSGIEVQLREAVLSHLCDDVVLASCFGFEISTRLSNTQLVSEPEEEMMVENVRFKFREEGAEVLGNTCAHGKDAQSVSVVES
jgi:hypothetical protein